MWNVQVTIRRWTSDDLPGWVECELEDASGRRHFFEEKTPVVSDRTLSADLLPCAGYIACTVVGDADGRGAVEIDTRDPWGIASVEGESRFTVPRGSLIHLA